MNAEETVLLVGFMTVSACLIIGTVAAEIALMT